MVEDLDAWRQRGRVAIHVERPQKYRDRARRGSGAVAGRALGKKLGGVGPGVSPNLAIQVGLKVDMERVPAPIAAGIVSGVVKLPVRGPRGLQEARGGLSSGA